MEKKLNKILVVAIIVVVIFISMGYSVLNRELSITGDLTYRPEGDIRITNVTQGTLTNAEIQYADFSKNEINFAYKSNSTPATVALKVEVTNYTDTEMGILKIDGLGDASISGYELKTKLKNENGSLKAGMSTTFIITFTSAIVETKAILLKFDFEPVYRVEYDDFKNTDGYKTEILKGDIFSQDFGSNAPKKVEVIMGEVVCSNYTYINGNITISNVDGNIVITAINAPSFIDSCDVHPNAPVLNGDMIPVVYDEEDKTWVKQNLNKSYDYCKQVWANAVTVKNTVNDVSENNNDGKTYGGAIVGNGEAILDGVDDYIDVGFANYEFTDGITMILRFKFNEIPQGSSYLIGNWEAAGGGLFYYPTTYTIGFELFDTVTDSYKNVTLKKELKANEYYTLVGTCDGQTVSFYLNGEKQSNNISIKIKKSPYSIIIGGNPNFQAITWASNITVSDALIFDKGLTEEEVNAHYSNEVTLGDTKPLVNYNFNDANREYYKKAAVGAPISIDDINTMWVWIPRYSYTIKSENETDYFGKASYGNNAPSRELPGEIDVKFIPVSEYDTTGTAKYIGSTASGWRTNEAFNFGESAQAGMWVAKFETTGSLEKNDQACINTSCDVSKVTIKPGLSSLRSQTVSSFFYMARSMQENSADTYGFSTSSGDLHMMKNDEWGAVAYLSQSKYGKYGNSDYTLGNKEIYQNKSSNYITGSSNGTPGQGSITSPQYLYDDMTNNGSGTGQVGPGASTTGNIYGIYDMSGGSYEYVMGVLEYDEQGSNVHNGQLVTGNSGFKGLNEDGSQIGSVNLPNEKYFNTYKSANPKSESWTDTRPELACDGGICYGHALSETGSWYQDTSSFENYSYPWFMRGGDYYYTNAGSGVFYVYREKGYGHSNLSCRLVLF